jgi:hypothetical protein
VGIRRAIALLPLVVAATISCSQSEDTTCEPRLRLGDLGEVAADRALSCRSFIEVDGLHYAYFYDANGCVEVDAPFLGGSIAFGAGAVARSIEGVPRHIALALAFPLDSEINPGECARGWHLWSALEMTRQEARVLQETICRVSPPEKPDPKSCTKASEVAVV